MKHRLGEGFALALASTAVALLAGCGGGGTTSESAKPLIPPQVQKDKPGIDPDELFKAGADAQTNIQALGNDRFQLSVQNTGDIGFINTFTWTPPPAMVVTAVANSHCQLASGKIWCRDIAIKPPKCTCLGGGVFTLRFDAKTKAGAAASKSGKQLAGIFGHSLLVIRKATPVPYKIPAYLGAVSSFADLPICKPGQQSTKDDRCIHGK
jgi:hypothetical protein